jgi:hypothetical protein
MQAWQILGAAGLASAWMLWWGLAAAIPILLHYLYRRRQTTIQWAAMQLLLQVVQRESQRVRLEQWLLLALRTLILLVLAAALARPFWQSAEAAANPLGSTPASTWIIAVDVSYSMGYRVDNETRLQAAQRRVAEFIESSQAGDAFALVALGQPPRAAIVSPVFDRQAVLTELGRLTLNDAGCDLGDGLQLIHDLAERARLDQTLPSQVHILILSDLGSDHWQAVVDGDEAKRLKQLGEQFPLDIESLADETITNLALTALRTEALRAVVGQPVELVATVTNYGTAPVEQIPVQLVVDGNTLNSQRVDVAGLSEQTVRLSYTPTSVGPNVVAAALPTDRLVVDNIRRQIIDVRTDYEVLFVEQQAGDARLLQLSLRPGLAVGSGQARSGLSVYELSTVELEKWPLVVLHDLSQLDSSSQARLERYVRQGGAVVCLLGPRTQAASWNVGSGGNGLLGFRLLEPSPARTWNIDPLEYQSPIVAPFAGFPDSGLLTTPIFRFWRIQVSQPEALGWQVELATEEGDPLIVRQRLGSGAVISLLSAPESGGDPNSSWNAMATWPSFVPLMQRLVQSAIDAAAANQTLLAGQPLTGKITAAVASDATATPTLTVVKPDGSESQIDVDLHPADGATGWTFVNTQQSGVYLVRSSPSALQQPYAVNVDGSEGSLQSLELAQLPKFSPPPPRAVETPASFADGVETSPWFARGWLLALGCLLVTESWLAWWLGRRVG